MPLLKGGCYVSRKLAALFSFRTESCIIDRSIGWCNLMNAFDAMCISLALRFPRNLQDFSLSRASGWSFRTDRQTAKLLQILTSFSLSHIARDSSRNVWPQPICLSTFNFFTPIFAHSRVATRSSRFLKREPRPKTRRSTSSRLAA